MVSSLYPRYQARRKVANIGATSRSLTTPTGMAAMRHAKRYDVSTTNTGDKVSLSIHDEKCCGRELLSSESVWVEDPNSVVKVVHGHRWSYCGEINTNAGGKRWYKVYCDECSLRFRW